MAMVTVDTRDLIRKLEKKGAKAHHYRAINKQAAAVIARFVDNKFEAQGPGWRALSAATLKRRRAGGKGARILQDTGILAGSFNAPPNSHGKQSYGYTTAEVSTNVKYAKFHLLGTKHMKKRDFFKIKMKAALNLVAKIMLEEIDG